MAFLKILLTLIIGIVMLITGVFIKKKWLILISVIPLVISLIQIIMLFLM